AVGDAAHLPPLVTVAQATWAASLEVVERPFFAIGFVALALLVPLAATSTVGMIRLMGGHRWRALHRLVYPAAIASVLHTYWALVTAGAALRGHPCRSVGASGCARNRDTVERVRH